MPLPAEVPIAPAAPLPGNDDGEVADRLAADGLAVLPGFLAPAPARRLLAAARALRAVGRFRPAGVGRGPSFRVRPEIRSDEVCWLEPGAGPPAAEAWMARMESLRLALNARLFLGLFGYEAHFSRYPPGAFYRVHVDRFADAPMRTVSAVLYLSQDWREEHGGALRIYEGGAGGPPFRDVAPEAGTLVLFLSDRFPHEVLPARRPRWSLTGWFTRRP